MEDATWSLSSVASTDLRNLIGGLGAFWRGWGEESPFLPVSVFVAATTPQDAAVATLTPQHPTAAAPTLVLC